MLNTRKSTWTGPAAKLVEQIYGSHSPASVFLSKARTLLAEAGQSKPPIDVFALASRLNVEVQEKKMSLDGYLERNQGGKFVVFLSRDASWHRRRFTLCHELAHTFLFDELACSRSFRGHDQYDPEEERLCDLAASEMLMPFATFNGDLLQMTANDGLIPNVIFKLMDRYAVSLQAVGNRIAWILRDAAVVLWSCDGPAINTEWAAPSAMKRVTLCQTGNTSVERSVQNTGRVCKSFDTYYMGRDKYIRRWTASRQMRSGKILSVVSSKELLSSSVTNSMPSITKPSPALVESAQLSFAF